MKRRNFFAALLGAPMAAKANRVADRAGHYRTSINIHGNLATDEQRRELALELASYVDEKLFRIRSGKVTMIESRRYSRDEMVQSFRL